MVPPFYFSMIHIGKLIKEELHRQERSITWFANKLCCERTNVYSIFKRESIDTILLFRISLVLHHNFFNYYIQELADCDFFHRTVIYTDHKRKTEKITYANFAPVKGKAMKQLIITTFTILSLASCASSIPINLSCDEQHIEIYVNDEYAGRGLIHYIVPKGDDYINVSCRENGIEIYSRTFYVKGKKNQLFELAIPKDYRYSSGQQIKPQIR